ncbi:hypothetical protein PISMIDRAFT_454144 [Pisolithus microcarpus 441]|uniref:Uncharacterized protein n=1 Tax=Pisolithus microcarpus 441 TaxID=765257 RepID=A0A0C9ZV30_9AGAM|nr:hypothetical protein PISMIDRAFT_454144 [Pisolithus microcarpus 441]
MSSGNFSSQCRSTPYYPSPYILSVWFLLVIMPGDHKSRITSDVVRIGESNRDKSIIPRRARNLMYLLLIGAPSLERFLEIV